MPLFNIKIENFVIGDDFEIEHVEAGFPDNVTVSKAWLTVTELSGQNPQDKFQKVITPVYASGEGIVTNEVIYTITTTQAQAQDDGLIEVRPIPILLTVGARLQFGTVIAELIEEAKPDATLLKVRPIKNSIVSGATANVRAASLLFEITRANSATLSPDVEYSFDIQLKTSNNKISTPVAESIMKGRRQRTLATS